MSAISENEATKPIIWKSKRFSSIVWIVVLWIFVRLIAEMDGLSWKRSFWALPTLFGIFPGTFFLTLAIAVSNRDLQKLFRWFALLAVLGSFFGAIALISHYKSEKNSEVILQIIQASFSVTVVLAVLIWRWILNRCKK